MTTHMHDQGTQPALDPTTATVTVTEENRDQDGGHFSPVSLIKENPLAPVALISTVEAPVTPTVAIEADDNKGRRKLGVAIVAGGLALVGGAAAIFFAFGHHGAASPENGTPQPSGTIGERFSTDSANRDAPALVTDMIDAVVSGKKADTDALWSVLSSDYVSRLNSGAAGNNGKQYFEDAIQRDSINLTNDGHTTPHPTITNPNTVSSINLSDPNQSSYEITVTGFGAKGADTLSLTVLNEDPNSEYPPLMISDIEVS